MRRSEERRDARERVAARPEALPATDDLVQRAELLRAVVDHVIALPEPYRSTILLRFFEERSSQEIAVRRGEPVETVRTRLKRGLAMLRDRLATELDVEIEDGRRAQGLRALAFLVEPARATGAASSAAAAATSGGVATVISGGSLMTMAAKLAIAAVAATTAGTWIVLTQRSGSRSNEPPQPQSRVAAVGSASAATSNHSDSALVAERQPSVAPESSSSAPAASDPIAPRAEGRKEWNDVTASSWKRLVKEDDGETMRRSIAGLGDETLDLAVFFQFLDDSFSQSIVVPGTEEATKEKGGDSVKWVQVYSNSNHERSAARLSWVKNENEEMATIELAADSWARENASRVDFSPEQLRPKLFVMISKYPLGNGFFGGMVKLDLGLAGTTIAESKALSEKRSRLQKEKRLPSIARFGFRDGVGSHGWTRSDSDVPITVAEMDRITAMIDRISKSGVAIVEAQSK
jgi:hypothetical protein